MKSATLNVTLTRNASDHMDTSTIKVHSEFKIEGCNGTSSKWEPIMDTNLVAPINLTGKSIFKKAATLAYHLRAYLETILVRYT